MRLAFSIWIPTIVCYVLLPESHQLQCWSCDYAKECNDPFNQAANRTILRGITEVESSPCIYCSKIKTKEYGYHYVERSCVPESMDYITHELGCSENTITGVVYTHCYCDEPYCNNNPPIKISAASFVALFCTIQFTLGY